MTSGNRTVLAVIPMVTLAPLVAVSTLVLWNPERWGGVVNPLSILVMCLFGLFTVSLWPTYLPAVVLTPLIMRRIADLRLFKQLPLLVVVALAAPCGAAAGVGVLSPVIPWSERAELVQNWVAAGATSGAVTLAVILFIFKFEPPGRISTVPPTRAPD